MSKEMKTRHCDECKHQKVLFVDEMKCTKGHKPRFYQSRQPMSTDWGYKRKCEDFAQKETK